MRDICTLFDSKLSPYTLEAVMKLLKANIKNRENLNAHIITKKDTFKRLKSLKDVSEMQRLLLIIFKTCNSATIKSKKLFNEYTEDFLKIKPKKFNFEIKDLLFKINLNNKDLPSFGCKKLELPTRLYNSFSTKIYMFLNENSIKFFIDKEIIIINYDSIESCRKKESYLEIKTATKSVKIYLEKLEESEKIVSDFIKERKAELKQIFECKNTATGISLKFLSDFSTETNTKDNESFQKKNTTFLENLDFMSSDENVELESPKSLKSNKDSINCQKESNKTLNSNVNIKKSIKETNYNSKNVSFSDNSTNVNNFNKEAKNLSFTLNYENNSVFNDESTINSKNDDRIQEIIDTLTITKDENFEDNKFLNKKQPNKDNKIENIPISNKNKKKTNCKKNKIKRKKIVFNNKINEKENKKKVKNDENKMKSCENNKMIEMIEEQIKTEEILCKKIVNKFLMKRKKNYAQIKEMVGYLCNKNYLSKKISIIKSRSNYFLQ